MFTCVKTRALKFIKNITQQKSAICQLGNDSMVVIVHVDL